MLRYHYDVVKDWTAPPRIQMVLMILIGLGSIIMGIVNIQLVSSVAAYVLNAYFGIGVGLFIIYLYGFRQGKPLIKTGVRNIVIDDHILKWNMKLFSEEIKVNLSDVESIQLLDNQVTLTLADGHAKSFRLKQILNPDKRREFQEVIANLQS